MGCVGGTGATPWFRSAHTLTRAHSPMPAGSCGSRRATFSLWTRQSHSAGTSTANSTTLCSCSRSPARLAPRFLRQISPRALLSLGLCNRALHPPPRARTAVGPSARQLLLLLTCRWQILRAPRAVLQRAGGRGCPGDQLLVPGGLCRQGQFQRGDLPAAAGVKGKRPGARPARAPRSPEAQKPRGLLQRRSPTP